MKINEKEIENELSSFYKKQFINSLSGIALYSAALENLAFHGHLCMPYTYKIRKQLTKEIKNRLNELNSYNERSAHLQQAQFKPYTVYVNLDSSCWSLWKVFNFVNIDAAHRCAKRWISKNKYSIDLLDNKQNKYIIQYNKSL